MKFDWQQLSPRERDALLRHFLLKRKTEPEAPVTAEKVCAALQQTHYLSFHTKADGKAVFRFVTRARGARAGASVSDNISDGIFKAALRAKGVEVEDGLAAALRHAAPRATHLARAGA